MLIIIKRKQIYIVSLLIILSIIIPYCIYSQVYLDVYPAFAGRGLPLIVVDAGHGGRDPGAVVGNIYEKDINLDIAKKLKRELNKRGYRVKMTRTKDTNLVNWRDRGSFQRASLWQRAHIANDYTNAVLISIHCNSDKNTRFFGAQTFFHPKSIKGKGLAISIQKELVKIRYTKRQAIPGDYYLLKNTQIPTVIVELGYLSNSQDRGVLSSASQRGKYARAIATGVVNWVQ